MGEGRDGGDHEFIPLPFIPSREGRGYFPESEKTLLRMKGVRIYPANI